MAGLGSDLCRAIGLEFASGREPDWFHSRATPAASFTVPIPVKIQLTHHNKQFTPRQGHLATFHRRFIP